MTFYSGKFPVKDKKNHMANLLSIQELQEGIVGDIPSTREGLAYFFFPPSSIK